MQMEQANQERMMAMKEKESELKGHSEKLKTQSDLMKKQSEIEADKALKTQDLQHNEQKFAQNLKFSAQKHIMDMLAKKNKGGKENGNGQKKAMGNR